MKSIWKNRHSHAWSFYCPLCRATRKVATRTKPAAKHYFQVGLTSVVFMLASWQWLGWKGIISFIPFWMVFEVLFRSRARVVLNCPHCGFDPYLYLVDAKRAREEIEAHWRRKFAEKNIPFPEKERPLEARARAAVAPAPAHPSPVEDAAEETVGV